MRSKLNTARGGCFRGLQPPRGKNEIEYSQRSLITIRTIIQLGMQEKNIYKITNSAVFKIRKGNRKLYLVTLVTSNTNRNTHTHTHFISLYGKLNKERALYSERRGHIICRKEKSLAGGGVDKETEIRPTENCQHHLRPRTHPLPITLTPFPNSSLPCKMVYPPSPNAHVLFSKTP